MNTPDAGEPRTRRQTGRSEMKANKTPGPEFTTSSSEGSKAARWIPRLTTTSSSFT